MTSLEDLVARYRSELHRLVAERRKLTALIDARREILRDLLTTIEDDRVRGQVPPSPGRGSVTQARAVLLVLGDPGTEMTAGEIYAAALAAGARGSERSLRNVLSRKVKEGELAVERGEYPYRYRLATSSGKAPTDPTP